MDNLLTALIFSFLLSFFITPAVISFANNKNILDKPSLAGRKKHKKPTPNLGGIPVVLVFLAVSLFYVGISRQSLGLLSGVGIVFIMGIIDDIKGIKAHIKLLIQIIACIFVLAGGIGIVSFTNPLDGTIIHLNSILIPVQIFGYSFNIIPIANAVSVFWMVLFMNAINLSDGLDGLAGGVSLTALVTILIISTSLPTSPIVVILTTIIIGSLLGFMPYNLFPAKIFLGDAGAYSLGLLLAVLPIYSNTKLTIGTVVVGVAVFDMFWAFLSRVLEKKSPFKPDRKHIHYRLLDSGIEHPKVVLIVNIVTIMIALATVMSGVMAGVAVLVAALFALMVFIKFF